MEKKMLVAELGRLGISVVEGEFVRKSEIRTVLASLVGQSGNIIAGGLGLPHHPTKSL